MKIKGSKAVHYDSGPNMTPLVDVVLVILIFLMLVGQFGGAEHYLMSNLPYTEKGLGGAKPPEGFVPDEPLDIRIDSPTPDKWVANAGKISTSDRKQLAGALVRMRDEYATAQKTVDQIQVIISPGKDVKYDYLMAVYDAAMEAKFTKISFAKSH